MDCEWCPVCGSGSQIIESLPAKATKDRIGKLLGDISVAALEFPDYFVRECNNCSLVFAAPMTPGDASFYSWLTTREGYYTDARWEWQEVRSIVAKELPGRTELLLADIGCGSGLFLKSLPPVRGCRYVGIDSSPETVAACRLEGLEVHQGDWGLLASLFPAGLDVVTAFHCLEHLPDPVGFVKDCVKQLRPGGRLYVSTPFYPSSTEEQWSDPLNAPPHHLTRWNMKAYQALAEAVECKARVHLPPAEGLLSRTVRSYRFVLSFPYASIGVSRKRRILSTALGIMLHPYEALTLFARQVKRQRIDGKVAPDVILVEIERPA